MGMMLHQDASRLAGAPEFDLIVTMDGSARFLIQYAPPGRDFETAEQPESVREGCRPRCHHDALARLLPTGRAGARRCRKRF